MTILIPRVWVTLPAGNGLLRSEATMLGRPTRVKGKPAYVEVFTDSGRHTLAPYEAVQASNEAGEALLAYVPPEPEAKASA
jgi:hypothetical protein